MTITGKLVNPVSLEPIRGSITIKATSFSRNTSNDSLYGNANFTVIPDVDTGDFTFDVAAVDEAGLDPTDFAYEATIRAVNGGRLTSFYFQVFEADAPGPVNLADIAPSVAASPVYASYVTSVDLAADLSDYVLSADLTATLGGYVTTSGLTSALGPYTLKPSVAEQLFFVTPRGNDSNDGLTLQTAKLTLASAVTALGGNPGKIVLGYGTISTGGSIDLSGTTGVVIEGGGSPSAGGLPITRVTHNVASASPAIELKNSIGARVSGFYLVNLNAGFTGPLINLSTTSGLATTLFRIKDMIIDGGTSAGGVGISASGAQNGSIENCNIIRNTVGLAGRVNSAAQTNVITVSGCRFGSNTTANLTNIGYGWTISGNNFEQLSGGGAGGIVNASGVTTRGAFISGNWFGDVTAGVGGIQIDIGGVGFQITGNYIGFNTTGTGVRIADSSEGFQVKGNYFEAGNSGDTGISLGSSLSRYDVGDNSFTNVATKIGGSSTSTAVHKVATDSTTAFMWQSTLGSSMLTINTNNGRVGVNTTNMTSPFHVAGAIATAYVSKTGNYTVTANDSTVDVDTTSGAITITLESAASVSGRVHTIRKRAGSNSVTVATTSSQTINGVTTYTLNDQYEYVTVVSDNANWIVVSENKGDAARGESWTLDSETLATGEIMPVRALIGATNVSLATGRMGLHFFTAKRTEAITTITAATGATAAGATPTICRYGVFSVAANGDITLIASTVNDTTLFAASNTEYPKALSSTWNKVAGARYAIGALVVTAATMPSFTGVVWPSSAGITAANKRLPMNWGRIDSLADLPTGTTAYASIVGYNGALEFVLS